VVAALADAPLVDATAFAHCFSDLAAALARARGDSTVARASGANSSSAFDTGFGSGVGGTGIGVPLSSERTRYHQTTVGALFCHAAKAELGAEVGVVNGAPIKVERT